MKFEVHLKAIEISIKLFKTKEYTMWSNLVVTSYHWYNLVIGKVDWIAKN